MILSTFSGKLRAISLAAFFILGLINITFAQLNKGKKLFFKQEYQKALPAFEEAIKENPKDAEALYYGGICHLQNYNNKTGLELMQKAISLNPKVDGKHQNYWLAIAYHYNYKPDSAEEYFNKYKASLSRNDPRRRMVNRWLRDIAMSNKQNNVGRYFWVEEVKTINTKHSEHSPLISHDGKTLIYTSRDKEVTGGQVDKDGDFFEDIYRVEKQADGTWSSPEKINTLLNTKKHDASCQLFDNGNQILLYREKNDGDLYVAKKGANNKWGTPVGLSKNINSKSYESHGFITADGKSIYFASNRNNPRGDLNLYVSHKTKDGKWGEAKKLGPNVNSLSDDDAPFVTPDGKELYFSSRGHNSLGGFDIFRCLWDSETNSWGTATNLGAPINTTKDDIYMVWEANGREGYFSSNRLYGSGEKDIYRFGKVYEIAVKGKLLDKVDKTPLANISIALKSTQDDIYYEVATDQNGEFLLELVSSKTYKLDFSLKGQNESNSLISFYQDSLVTPLAKEPHLTLVREFYIPAPQKEFQLYGTVRDLYNLDALSGKLIVKSDEKTLAKVDVKDGKFQQNLKAIPNKTLSLSFQKNDLIYPDLAQITFNSESKIKQDLKVGNDALVINDIETSVKEDNKMVVEEAKSLEKGKLSKAKIEEIIAKNSNTTKISIITKDKNSTEENTKDLVAKNKVTKLKHEHETIKEEITTDIKTDPVIKEGSSLTKILENIYFGFNEDQLGQESKKDLDQVVEIMKQNPNKKILLTGHADFKGDSNYNTKLSKKRVNRVSNYLAAKGIEKNRISISHFGEQSPTAPNQVNGKDAPNNRQLNRRVEIIDLDFLPYLNEDKTLLVLDFKNETGTQPINGDVEIIDIGTKQVLLTGKSSNGVFQSPLSIKPDRAYEINFKQGTQSFQYASTFIAPKNGVIYREIKVKVEKVTDDKPIVKNNEKALNANIFYDFDKYDIRPDAALELEKWVGYLSKHPTQKIELISHTDSRGNKAYNIALSKQRIEAVISYFTSHGVSSSRIHKKLWFGEDQLTNKCQDGVSCNEKLHQRNRRTEIRLLEQ